MKLGIYTTIHGCAIPYLRPWYESLKHQSDQTFELWIGLDQMDTKEVKQIIGEDFEAHWIAASSGDTPADIRQKAFSQIVDLCDGVVLVDSDDILHPLRVAAARRALLDSDLTGCALRIVDAEGKDLALTMTRPLCKEPTELLPRNNLFGLSNSAYRTSLLRRCLPIERTVVLVDWYLATRAWLLGARISFDDTIRMYYRQHGANLARVRAPFTSEQVASDTEAARNHFQLVRLNPPDGYVKERYFELTQTADEVEIFYRSVVLNSARLDQYVAMFNTLTGPPLWWASVANPALRALWYSSNHS